MATSRPVNTQMPKTPIPPTRGSGGGPRMVTNLGTLGAKVPTLSRVEKPGPLTAPSAQGPTRSTAR